MRHGLASLIGVVRRSIARHDMFRAGERVLVAVSGGCDSTGLALVLSELRRRLSIELVAAHVHHGLRGEEADLDQECAAETAARLGLPFVAVALPTGSLGDANIEARAREARYASLAEMARAGGCTRIATGHTLDDQAETFLLRLLRGAGAAGLAAVQPHRDDGVVRPLIDCRRSAVAAAVEAAGLRYRVDGTNLDPRFLRTQVRARLLPLLTELNPSAVEGCARAADRARGDAALARRWVEEVAPSLGVGRELPIGALEGVPVDARGALVRHWLRSRLGSLRGVATAHVDAIVDLAAGAVGGREAQLPGPWLVRRRGRTLLLVGSQATPSFAATPLHVGEPLTLPGGWRLESEFRQASATGLPEDLWSAVLDGETAAALTVRPPRPGERVAPLGLGGTRSLAAVLAEHGVSRRDRAVYPVVATGDRAVWLPGVVRGDSFLVGPHTRRQLWLRAARG